MYERQLLLNSFGSKNQERWVYYSHPSFLLLLYSLASILDGKIHSHTTA